MNFKKLCYGKAKLYLVNFYRKNNNKYEFSKIGHTTFVDAADRFKYEPEQYRHWNIKVMFSVVGPLDIIKNEEENIHSFYKKDFWLPEEYFFKGITEIRKYSYNQVSEIINYMKGLKHNLTVNNQQVKNFIKI